MNFRKTILVTGAAGFIGYHLCEALIKLGHNIIALDNINQYYDVNLKYARLKQLGISKIKAEKFNVISESKLHGNKLKFVRMSIEEREVLPKIFRKFSFDIVCNFSSSSWSQVLLRKPRILY